jgi:hypothetical protein
MKTSLGIFKDKNFIIFLVALIFFIALITPLPYKLIDWYDRYALQHEKDPLKRIVMVNMTLERDAKYWNQVYLHLTANADTLSERVCLAGLILDRFGANSIQELEFILNKETSEKSKSNISEIIKIIENDNTAR